MSIVTPIVSRANVSLGGLTKGITGAISSVVDPVQELFGVKSEIYTIGYIPTDDLPDSPLLQNGLLGGLIKTYQNAANMVNQFGASITSGQPKQYGITIDGFFNHNSDFAVDLPENPLMYDTPIVDHRIRTPDTTTMNVFISAYKTDNALEEFTNILANNDLVSMITGTSGDTARIRRKLNEFRWLQNYGRPFKVYTPHGVLENMVLQKISAKNDEQTMDGWAGTLVFREVVYYTKSNDTSSKVVKAQLSGPSDSFVKSLLSIVS